MGHLGPVYKVFSNQAMIQPQQLFQIPFLELDLDFEIPIEEINKEALAVKEDMVQWWPPNVALDQDTINRHTGYKQLAITTIYSKRDHTELSELNGEYYERPEQERRFYVTNLAKQKLPKTLNILSKITDKPWLAKLIVSPPGHTLGFHNHTYDQTLNYKARPHCIFHIPLIESGDTVHWVAEQMPEDRKAMDKGHLSNQSGIWGKQFELGKVTVFNSTYPHAVGNYGTKERLSIMCYNDFERNPTLRHHLGRALKKYDGPLISYDKYIHPSFIE